jgi:membrane fusion protein (multidrug efflux system)
LSRITKKEVKFYVPENLKENLEMWKEVIFSLWGNKESSFTGTIYRISPEVDEKTFSITVQARVDEKILLPNKSTIRVNLKTKEEIFKIPSSSIYNKEERKIVYYKKENWKLGVRDINIVSDDGEYSLVTWNFDDTLKVVTTPIFIK